MYFNFIRDGKYGAPCRRLFVTQLAIGQRLQAPHQRPQLLHLQLRCYDNVERGLLLVGQVVLGASGSDEVDHL